MPSLAAQLHRKWQAGPSAAARAAVPYELSEALYRGVVRYWSVPSLLDLRPFRRHRHVAVKEAARADGPGLFPVAGPRRAVRRSPDGLYSIPPDSSLDG